MIRLNARAELDKVPFADVAREFSGLKAQQQTGFRAALFAPDFGRLLAEHLGLVFGSLAIAMLVGVPLGLLAARVPWLAQPVLVATGLLQTIPALALLAFLIPLTGTIGVWPALIALFLYALLPITRNTHTGIIEVPRGLVQAGTALGLSRERSPPAGRAAPRDAGDHGGREDLGGDQRRHRDHRRVHRRRRLRRAHLAGPGAERPRGAARRRAARRRCWRSRCTRVFELAERRADKVDRSTSCRIIRAHVPAHRCSARNLRG